MAIFDLYSKRQRKLRGELPDVYTYSEVPQQLRVQLVHVFRDLLGNPRHDFYEGTMEKPAEAYKMIVDILCREYGLLSLSNDQRIERDYATELLSFFLAAQDTEQALDVIELCLQVADALTRNFKYLDEHEPNARVDGGIEEVNGRLREHGVGFQFESGQLVRVDSDLLHAEAVKPALQLLRTTGFSGPREEFLRAYGHYRHGNFPEALNEALKSFESTMKAICDQRGWRYENGATAKKLVNTCLSNGLIEPFWETHIAGVRATLENGIATVRNKLGGHGQGSESRDVPSEVVAYALHLAAATIVFLIESSRRLEQSAASP